jgi:hypothetical protein
MREVLLTLVCVLAGCGSGPAPGAPKTTGSETGEVAPAEVESTLRAVEEEHRFAGAELRTREPEFAPLDRKRLEAMVEFMPGWRLTCAGQFALLHTPAVDDDTARKALRLAATTTLEMFREDPRASPLEPPLLRCVDEADKYHAYGGPPGTKAFYSGLHNEIVFLKFHGETEDTFTVLRRAVQGWFKETSPREIEKKLEFLKQWSERRRSGR